MSLQELKNLIQQSGIVGAGGAGFPSHAKLADGADILALNCAECEPLIYTDYMLMREHLQKIARGATLVMDAANIAKTLLCIKAHRAEMLGMEEGDEIAPRVYVKLLPDAYPMGDEINLIFEATGRVVKPGQLPITAGVIVLNGETAYNIARAADEQKPVIEKWVTIGGNIENRVVVRVPVGMRVCELFRALNITVPEGHTVLDGGPSMGRKIRVATATVGKTTKSLLILPDTAPAIAHKNIAVADMLRRAASCCCGCSRCTEMCPRHLLGYPIEPHKMIRAANNDLAKRNPELIKTASLCCSCGVCETAACCQNISPRNVIMEFKSILAKNRLKYVGNEDVTADEFRDSRLIPIDRWKSQLGVKKFDREGTLVAPIAKTGAVEIGLNLHIGAPSALSVKVGDVVKAGDKIAEAGNGLSIPAYASIDGKVTYADAMKVVIESI